MYSCSEKELQALREYLDENLAKGFIRESSSPAGYPILFVPKKNGKLRLCVDYQKLNDIIIKNCYPLPCINEIMDHINGTQWYTKLDLQGAYNLIRITQGKEWKITFCVKIGFYEYLVMPMGLTNAPASFQALMNHVLRDHIDKIYAVYLNNILVYSKDPKEHDHHVKLVLQKLEEYFLKVDLDKSEFDQEEVEFLGHIIGKNGIRMDPRKVQSVLEWPTPENLKDLQAFLGLANYYR